VRITIGSGSGVDEVSHALWHFYHWLLERYAFETIKLEYAHFEEGYRSIILESDDEGFFALEGRLLWRVQSPFRPKHRRKNWYFSLVCEEHKLMESIDPHRIIYETMRSPKKGGQHVNRRSTGVRACYPPLGIEAISYDERSQHQNKQIALQRLYQKIERAFAQRKKDDKRSKWRENREMIRGNPIKTFEGEYFQEVN
jgi:peptide chain release factor